MQHDVRLGRLGNVLCDFDVGLGFLKIYGGGHDISGL